MLCPIGLRNCRKTRPSERPQTASEDRRPTRAGRQSHRGSTAWRLVREWDRSHPAKRILNLRPPVQHKGRSHHQPQHEKSDRSDSAHRVAIEQVSHRLFLSLRVTLPFPGTGLVAGDRVLAGGEVIGRRLSGIHGFFSSRQVKQHDFRRGGRPNDERFLTGDGSAVASC